MPRMQPILLLALVGAASPVLGARPPAQYQLCKGAVQEHLRFGISGRTTPAGVNALVNQTESLAEAVCCDKRAELVAEPRYLYEAPDIQFFTKVDPSGVTTYYDSVCGVPLFRAPIGRSFEDFQADTVEHGWPSFRPEEVVEENVITNRETKLITSVCGTHLGTLDPDAKGDRWCIDLSCMAGSPANETKPTQKSTQKSTQPPPEYQLCKGAVQEHLRFGISGRTTPAGVNALVNQTESLAEAVCCDKRAELVAEPRYLYEAPDIQFFTKVDPSGVTTYYDSVCGVPLFRAPIGRSFEDFQADTVEHGWPSFRPEEVVEENVITNRETKLITSVCGTHLGTLDPDAKGDRWCIDLSCMAGSPQ